MPTYTYQCSEKECSHEWEEEQSIKAEPTKVCPKCLQETARRTIAGSTAFVLNGRGWARDGYK